MNIIVFFGPRLDDALPRTRLRPLRRLRSLITGRDRVHQHLPHRLAYPPKLIGHRPVPLLAPPVALAHKVPPRICLRYLAEYTTFPCTKPRSSPTGFCASVKSVLADVLRFPRHNPVLTRCVQFKPQIVRTFYSTVTNQIQPRMLKLTR
jgi:hypothetical protein